MPAKGLIHARKGVGTVRVSLSFRTFLSLYIAIKEKEKYKQKYLIQKIIYINTTKYTFCNIAK